MTGIDRDRQARRVRWAAEELGLSPGATREEARTAWLRRLPEEDFVPPSEARDALEALLGRRPGGGWQARADEAAFLAEEERLRGEVEAFAEVFWDLTPGERDRRWQEMMGRCASPSLHARLHQLEPGLDVVRPSSASETDARVAELAGYVCELFVLRPAPRARARQALLHRMGEERKQWKDTVKRLRRVHPELAPLGSDLLDKIATEEPAPKRLPEKSPRQLAPANSGGTSKYWPLWLVVVLVGGLIRMASNAPHPKPLTPPAATYRFPKRTIWMDEIEQGPPDTLDRLFEKQSIQDEELKRKLKEVFERRKTEPAPGGRRDGSAKPDGKSP